MKNLYQLIDYWYPRILIAILLIVNAALAANTIYHISVGQPHCAIPSGIILILFVILTIHTICKL